MSDHDAAPDPMDKAYAQAEAMLSDEAARAARRARVLAAVAATPATAPAAAPAPAPPAWRRGGWLAAAGVAGLSVLVATQIHPPTAIPPAPAAPPASAPAPAASDVVTTPDLAAPRAELRPTLPVPARAEPSPQPPTVAVAPDTAARDVAPAEEPAAPPPPPVPTIEHRIAPPPAAPRAAAPAPAAARSSSEIQELVVTSERRQDSRREVPAALLKRGSPAELALALRDAAGAGRIADLKALLARGVPVDAPDDEGETALMKAIQADQPAAAALLRRHRASVDLKNRAGVSARDMATAMDDAELNRALGLRR